MCSDLACPWPSDLPVQEFVTLVNRLAVQVSQRFPGPVGQNLLEDAVSHVYLRLERLPAEPEHRERWCYRVLCNRARDLGRGQRRVSARLVPLDPDTLTLAATPDPSSPHGEDTQKILRDLGCIRTLLYTLRWQPRTAEDVDHFAVLLLHLRLVMAARMGRVLTGSDPQPEGGLAQFLTRLLPWHAREQRLRCKRGLPTLTVLWGALTPLIDVPPCRVTAAQLCGTLARLQPRGTPLNPTLWAQWCRRARMTAATRMGAAAWDRYFASWLPGGDLLPGANADQG